jgi:excinuclease ABC subunit C
MPNRGLVLAYDASGALELVLLADDVESDAARVGGARVDVVGDVPEDVLLERFVALLAEHRPRRNTIVVDEPDHPHVRLTSDRFPRLLATRRPRHGDPLVFGPFLPRTAARRLLGLAGHLCRLRTCTIDVDGTFEEPCGEHAAGRCLGPCVEAVEDAALLAGGDWEQLAERYAARMADASDALDFEAAARWRDAGETLAVLGPDLRLRAGLAGATDVVAIRREAGIVACVIATAFRGKVVGRRTFVAPTPEDADDAWVLAQILAQAYRSDAPSQIVTPVDGAQIRLVARALGRREGRRVAVTLAEREALAPTLRLAVVDAEGRLAERFAALRAGRPFAALEELADTLGLPSPPRRIEAFDVAHIGGEAMTAAAAVCRDGEQRPEESAVWYLGAPSELAAMEAAVGVRVTTTVPDLVLVDGGRPQLSAAARGLTQSGREAVPLVAVVKRPGRPREVAYLLARGSGDEGRRFELPERSEALRLVVRLRDAAHAAANAAHRAFRERAQLAREPRREPVVVPTRTDDPDGAASDLIPIPPRMDGGGRPFVRAIRRKTRFRVEP